MTAKAIMRVGKLKSLGSVGGSEKHTARLQDTTNADPYKENIRLLASSDDPELEEIHPKQKPQAHFYEGHGEKTTRLWDMRLGQNERRGGFTSTWVVNQRMKLKKLLFVNPPSMRFHVPRYLFLHILV